VMWWN